MTNVESTFMTQLEDVTFDEPTLHELVNDNCDSDLEDAASSDVDDEIDADLDIDVVQVSTDWRPGACNPTIPVFTGQQGLQVPMDSTSPHDYLKLFITDSMMESIVTETNRYAADFLRGKVLSPRSRYRYWEETTVPEMWGFFGLIIAMGLIIIPDLDDYWSTDELYKLEFFRSTMARDRFALLLSFLHLSDSNHQPSRDSANFDPLYKIRSFLRPLVENFKKTYIPGPNIALDEAMVAWRGPLAFRVYNPEKPDKFGVKMFEVCDSDNGYCANLEIYSGRVKNVSQHGLTFDVVNRLMKPYVNSGRTLYVDNYYTSPTLFTYLLSKTTLACGTVRLNRKFCPPKTLLTKLPKGASASYTNGTLNMIRFHDKREVSILTTAFDDSKAPTGKTNHVTGEQIVKFSAVKSYNSFMGAVDRSDQMVTYNTFKRRTVKWWKKVFFHLFMLATVNSYIVYKSVTRERKMEHNTFRRELAKQLCRMAPTFKPVFTREVVVTHFPSSIRPKEGAKKRAPQKKCRVCKLNGRRRDTRFECVKCDTALCIEPCFQMFHEQRELRRASTCRRLLW